MTPKHSSGSAENATWIEPYQKTFLERLKTQGYSACTIRSYERDIAILCEKIGNRTPGIQKIGGSEIEDYEQAVLSNCHERVRIGVKCHLRRFIEYLVEAGVTYLPEPPMKEPGIRDGLRAEYDTYLRVQRGLSEPTIRHCLSFFERFMNFRFGDELGELNAITPEDIVSFFHKIRTKTKPYRGRTLPSHLRNLFKFLFWSGKTMRNLANSIPRIAQPQPTILPRYMKPDEIQRLIDSVRSNDAIGRRNYAMMLLIARLGLRAVEVVAIRLEDIDWRAGEILIRGKGKFHEPMPLPSEVGEAIVNYVKNGRVGDSRTLFISDRAPHKPFKDAQILRYILHKAFEKTGLKSPQKHIGSHLLRHSLATNMLGKGASLEEISHVLRHRSRVTTSIYAKCDIGALRSVAQAWPLEGGVA